MEFKGISRTFSTVGEVQYNTIGAFWDELSERYGTENLRGLGYNWTSTTIEYVIGLKTGDIEGWNVSVSLPDDGWTRVEGRTDDLGAIYNEIYKDGPLKYEIEMFDDDGNCVIDFVRSRRIVVEPYNNRWPIEFEKIKGELEHALGNLCISIEHVGSTSVKGLSAKPIIDIDVIIEDYSIFPKVVCRLHSIGYTHEGDLGIKDREAFKYNDKLHLQQHHLYVCPKDSIELHRHMTFRDYLRSHPEAIEKYSKVKEEAAKLYPDSIEKYIEYKAPCIAEIYSLCGLDV